MLTLKRYGELKLAQLQGDAKRKYVGNMFARIARRYDLMNTLMTGGMHHCWRRKTARLATHGLSGLALDVGSGTGDLAFALASCPGITDVVGLDLVVPMLSIANDKSQRSTLHDRVHFMAGDALSLPFPDSVFVSVASGFVLRNMPDLKRSLQEMVRVLKPGGRLATLEIFPLERGVFKPFFRFYFRRIVPVAGAVIARDRSAYAYLPSSVDRFLTAGQLAELLRTIDLKGVSYQRLGLGTVAIHLGTKP